MNDARQPAGVNGTDDSMRDELQRLAEENQALRCRLARKSDYIRCKTNQMLSVMGTLPLRPEELDDESLVEVDPIGIVCDSFSHILTNLHDTNALLCMASNEREAILAAAEVGILVLDRNMVIHSCNAKLKEYFFPETDSVEAVGQLCRDLICKSAEPAEGCMCRQVVEDLTISRISEWQFNHRIFEVVGAPIFDAEGAISKIVAVYKDITQLKETAKALAAEKERLAVTLRSIGDGVITTDITGRVVLMNKVAEQLTGWKQHQAAGQPLDAILHIINEKTREKVVNPAERVLATGTIVMLEDNTILVARDGRERLIADSAAPICDSDSSIMGTVLVVRDVTEKHALEAELHRAQILESVGILAGGIAHDFNNMLTGIVGNISIARMALSSNNVAKAADRLMEAEKASLRARTLTQQLLTFSKGGVPVKKTSSVVDILNDAAAFALSGSNVRWSLHTAADLWQTEIDEGQISQVIHNLVINADQAMPDGGEILITADNIMVGRDQSLPVPDGRYIRLSISDTGTGIAPSDLPRIFTPYFTTKENGSGLGLATSYSIVKNHGGCITVDSHPGRGSVFHVVLPASSRPAAADTPKSCGSLRGRGKVLVMDDEEVIREVVGEMLYQLGYDVSFAESGETAVSLYRESLQAGATFDAVIMDLTIRGGMGGVDAMRELLAIDPEVTAIVSSGYSNDPVMSGFSAFGFKGVVVKPYVLQDLGKVMHDVLHADGRQDHTSESWPAG